MRFAVPALCLLSSNYDHVLGFVPNKLQGPLMMTGERSRTSLFVSVGLGPGDPKEEDQSESVAGVDYEIPDHELYRTSRRTEVDETCDKWFGSLLGDSSRNGILGELSEKARDILMTPVPLVNEIEKPFEDEEWTPYVMTKLPWTPLTPAFGLEEFGLPVPRRNAETWRQFDVVGMVGQDYSSMVEGTGTNIEFSEDEVASIEAKLDAAGGWISDDGCEARLVYINGRFAPQLSKTSDVAKNLDTIDDASQEIKDCLARLTDGFTDKLAAPVPSGSTGELQSFAKLSGPDHSVGEPITQFAINTQQGTACFAALNTILAGSVAYVHSGKDANIEKTVLVVNAVTADGGASPDASKDVGVLCNPRTLILADEGSRLSIVQSCVDLAEDTDQELSRPKLYNGYSQVFLKAGANVTHSYLEETGGTVTSGVEMNDKDVAEGMPLPREVEAVRPPLKDTHLEAVDVQLAGDGASYEGVIMSIGGSGRVRIGQSVTLVRPDTHAKLNGFALSGGAQRTDFKTNIHHVAQGTSSEQLQKNMVGGRATAAFRGRIRVEQSAQQTDSQQLSRTVLLSDRSRAWNVPSLEIIADDVQCTHGATVSDLSEEELFYLRSRGIDRATARNLLMYAFAGEACAAVDPAMVNNLDSQKGLQKRIIRKLENVVPQGQRAIQGEFQSS